MQTLSARSVRHAGFLTLSLLTLALAACAPPAVQEPAPRAVRVLTVAPGAQAASHEYAAEIRPRTEARLAFRVGGKVTRRWVGLGDAVKVGQPLASLDPQDLQLAQSAAQAALASAQAQLDLSEAEFKRYKELRDQGFISGLELERRETALKAARAAAQQVRAQAGVQGNQAGYAVLSADAAGIVTGVDVEPGVVVAAGQPVLRVAQDGPRDAVFSVPEDRVAPLRALLGRPGALRVLLWSQPEALPATVREVAAAADPVTRTFAVKADVGRADLQLGQTARVQIDTPAPDALLRLPLPAVFEQQGRSHVWVLEPATMTVRAREVKLAGADGNQVVVQEGLTPGLQIVSAGVHVLTAGQKVRLYQEPGAPAAVAGAASATGATGAGEARVALPLAVSNTR